MTGATAITLWRVCGNFHCCAALCSAAEVARGVCFWCDWDARQAAPPVTPEKHS